MRKKLQRLVQYEPYNYSLKVYLIKWLPFGQGIFLGWFAIVQLVYYMSGKEKTDVICWEETNDVIKHEYGHLVSRKQRGFFNFWGNIIWDYIRFWIPHNLKLMEIEANDIKLGLK